MPEKAVILIVPEVSKLPVTLAEREDLKPLCRLVNLSSFTNFDAYISSMPDVDAPIVVIGYASATEVAGAERELIEKAKTFGLAIGRSPRLIIGVSALDPYLAKLKEFGCDVTCSEDLLPHHLIAMLKS